MTLLYTYVDGPLAGSVMRKQHRIVTEVKDGIRILEVNKRFTYISKAAFENSQQHVIWNFKDIGTLLLKNSHNQYRVYNRDDGYFVEDKEPNAHLVESYSLEVATLAVYEYLHSVLDGLHYSLRRRGLTLLDTRVSGHPNARTAFDIRCDPEHKHFIHNAIQNISNSGSMIGSDGHIREFTTHLTNTHASSDLIIYTASTYVKLKEVLPSSIIVDITAFKKRYDAFNIIPPFPCDLPNPF